jgi:hypothetical protein
MSLLLSPKARSIPFQRCICTGFNAGSKVDFLSATPRYLSTFKYSNSNHGPSGEETGRANGGINGGVLLHSTYNTASRAYKIGVQGVHCCVLWSKGLRPLNTLSTGVENMLSSPLAIAALGRWNCHNRRYHSVVIGNG